VAISTDGNKGKYGEVLDGLCKALNTNNAILIVEDGVMGSGFSVPADEEFRHIIQDTLEHMARQIRQDMKGVKH